MKAIILYAAMPGFEHGLNDASKIISTTLTELGVEVEEINLAFSNLHYYDGVEASIVNGIIEKLKGADGIVFASSVHLSAPCAVMQTFIEYLDFEDYRDALKGKSCLVVTTSKDTGEREAAEYISKVITGLGGYDALRVAIGGRYQGEIGGGSSKETLEKYVEDYYRYIRQSRSFFIPYEPAAGGGVTSPDEDYDTLDLPAEQFTKLFGHEPRPKKIKPEELEQKLNLDSFTKKQEQDIGDIAKMLSEKYDETAAQQSYVQNIYKNNRKFTSEKVVPRIKTCRQRTQSLEHYYNPHIAGGLEAIFQFHISGEEPFEAYLTIEGNNCVYTDGVHDTPSISVHVDSKTWTDVLNGKYTAQKAFMTGQLKVRGNFVLLTRFDQIFKKEA